MAAFRVPDDLADKDLTIAQVIEILDNRRKRTIIQNRLDRLPSVAEDYKASIKRCDAREAELLKPTEDEASK